MKRNFKKPAKNILMLGFIGIVAAACNKNVLDKTDLNGVSPSTVWNVQSTANEVLNGTYDLVMPNWPTPGSIHNTSDELNNVTVSILNGTLTGTANEITDIGSANKEANNPYWWINRCNQGIDGLNAGSMDPASKTLLKGQFFFLRAYTYFNLIRIYGGVPLVLHQQDPSNLDSLYVPRAKTSVCVKQICADLDSATAMLPASWTLSTDGGRITRSVAMAYKGKTLLYWASPQFNPTNIASRWQDAYAACKLAYTQAMTDGYGLYPASKGGLGNLWLDETASNVERMMWRTIDAVSVNPTHGTNNENITRPVSETASGGGSNQPTWNLVQAFPMANGLPITDPNSGYDATMYWLNRDPRFAQTIAYNGSIWNLSNKLNRHEWTYTGFLDDASKASSTGFYCRKICNPSVLAVNTAVNSTTGGGSGMDWIELRFAEVLLNYAEAANAIGNLSESQGLVATLRAARGFSAGNYNYGMANITTTTAMATFLLTEREVEFAMEGKRYWDLRRTRTYDKLTGTSLNILKLAVNSPYVAGAIPTPPASGKTYIDVAPVGGGRICDTITVNYRSSYTKFFTPSITTLTVSGGSPVINYPTTYYFYPIPPNFLATDPLMTQNIGWPGGTFDPLQ